MGIDESEVSEYLTPKQSDEIGTELGVTIGKPERTIRHYGQHCGIYQDGKHIGDITSGSTMFTEKDLRAKIGKLLA